MSQVVTGSKVVCCLLLHWASKIGIVQVVVVWRSSSRRGSLASGEQVRRGNRCGKRNPVAKVVLKVEALHKRLHFQLLFWRDQVRVPATVCKKGQSYVRAWGRTLHLFTQLRVTGPGDRRARMRSKARVAASQGSAASHLPPGLPAAKRSRSMVSFDGRVSEGLNIRSIHRRLLSSRFLVATILRTSPM